MHYNRLMKYNWQQPDWPNFRYDLSAIQERLFSFAERAGRVSGVIQSLSEPLQAEAIINLMVSEAIKTSEIEGEYLSREDVLSSIHKNLGLATSPKLVRDKRAKGAADLMVDVRNTFADPLTQKKLFEWHEMLMAGQSKKLTVGAWRTHKEPMRVISGPVGKWKVHFEAPPSKGVPQEMKAFIAWFNNTAPGKNQSIRIAPVRAAIAHLYFESIHPYEDGNGRIGRAVSEKALAQSLGRPVLLSLSKTIEANKTAYYKALETAQRSNEITPWIEYFVTAVFDAQCEAEEQIDFILRKSKFFDQYRGQINERQRKVILRMFDEGPQGFQGGMSAKKYVSITGASKATATRDLQFLVELGVLKQTGGGRSTRYEVNF